ncbi:unnamed protein product [Schistosoma guineensis]|nr:unnamed protein product [Schistosoma guineensis]
MHKLYPWFILISAALSVIFLGGKRRAFGIFIAKLHSEYNSTTLVELNWIGDSYSALGYLTTSITTSMILYTNKKYGITQFFGAFFILLACITSSFVLNPHWLFITHTILHGIGSSFILSTCSLIVNDYFYKNHPYHILATTLVSGGSVASILFIEFYAYLIDLYNWRLTFIILGIIYFIILFITSIIFYKKNTLISHVYKSNPSNDHHQWNLWNICWNLYWQQKLLLLLWFMDRIITSIVTYGMLLNLTDYVYQHETLLQNSILLTNLFASGEATTYIIGALLTGYTKNLLKNQLKYILILSSICMSIGLILWEYFAWNSIISIILSYMNGFFLGPSITFLYPVSEEMTLLPGYISYSLSLSGMGIGMLLSPLLSAFIAETFQYHWFFLIQGIIVIIKSICLLCSWRLIKHLIQFNKHLLYHKQHDPDDHDDDDDEEEEEEGDEGEQKQQQRRRKQQHQEDELEDQSLTFNSETQCLISPMIKKQSNSKMI